jgi:hypothetical protein
LAATYYRWLFADICIIANHDAMIV